MKTIIANQSENRHVHIPSVSLGARIKTRAWHLVQMIIAMQVGMLLYHAVFVNLLAPASYKALTLANPLFDYWMMMVAMTLPMIIFMRFHRHGWRYCGGMTAAMLAPIIILTVFVLVGLVPITILHGSGMALMIVGMALYMFLHSD